MFAKELFKLGCQHTGGKSGQHRALISGNWNESKENQRFRRAGAYIVGAGQAVANQHQAQHNADDRAAAEILEGGPADQGRQEGKGGIGEDLGEE